MLTCVATNQMCDVETGDLVVNCLAQVVQRLDSFIQRIRCHPVDKICWLEYIFIPWIATCPLDRVIHSLNKLGLASVWLYLTALTGINHGLVNALIAQKYSGTSLSQQGSKLSHDLKASGQPVQDGVQSHSIQKEATQEVRVFLMSNAILIFQK